MPLSDLSFLITAKDATAAAFASTRAQIAGLKSDVGGLSGGLGSLLTLGKAFAGGFVAQVGIEGLEKLAGAIGDVVSATDDLQKTSDRVGIATDALQELQYQAKLTGASADDISSAMDKFGQNIGKAATGTGDLAKVLALNNVPLKDASGHLLPLLTQYKNYAELVHNATSEEQKLYLVETGFGKGHDDLTNMLSQGAQGFSDSADEARRFGDVLDPALVKRMADIADDWTRFTASASTVTKEIILNVVSSIAGAAAGVGDIFTGPTAPQNLPGGAPLNPGNQAYLRANADRLAKLAAQNPKDPNYAKAAAAAAQQVAALSPDPMTVAKTQATQLLGSKLSAGDFNTTDDGTWDFKPTKTPVAPDPAAEAAQKKIDAAIASLQQENTQLGLTDKALAEYQALTKAGIDQTNKMAPSVLKAADALYDHQQELKKDADAQKTFNDEVGLFADTGYRAFDDLITGAKSFKDVIKDDVIPALEEAVLQATLLGTGPLAGAFGTAPVGGKTTGGLLGTIGSAIVGAFTGPHAGGGFIPPGMWGTAGEDGPEPVYGGKTGMTVISNRGNGGQAQAPGGVLGHIRLELASELLNARIVQVSGPLSLELFKSGQKDLRRQQGLAG